MSQANNLINRNLFIVLGGHKCGTTSLHHYLKQHPEIAIPRLKARDIFNKSQVNLEDYYQQYDVIINEKVAGEVSSAYLYSKRACQNIKQYFPKAKLIAILRNPYQRAFSNFNDLAETHPLRSRYNFTDICENPQNFIHEGIVYLGLYYSYLKMYFDIFDSSQIKVLFFENFVKNKQAFFTSLFDFVEVDANFLPDTSVVFRKGGKAGIKNPIVNKFFNEQNTLRSFAKNLIKPFTTSEQRNLLYLKTKNLFVQRKSTSSIPNELKEKMISFYREDILKTQDLLGINLSHWIG